MVALPFSRLGVMVSAVGVLLGVRIAKRGGAQLSDVQKGALISLGVDPVGVVAIVVMFACGFAAYRYPLWSAAVAIAIDLVWLLRSYRRYNWQPWPSQSKRLLIAGTAIVGSGVLAFVVLSALGVS